MALLNTLIARFDREFFIALAASRQFHQHFKRGFFVRKSFWQLFSSYILAKKALSNKKCARKMLMKLAASK